MRTLLPFLSMLALAGCNRIEEIKAANGSTIDLSPGARFSISRGTSPTVSPEYQYSWHAPEVSGSSVVYEGPGESKRRDSMPGSSGEQVFLFKAVQAGESTILIRLNAGPKVENREDFTLKVRVR